MTNNLRVPLKLIDPLKNEWEFKEESRNTEDYKFFLKYFSNNLNCGILLHPRMIETEFNRFHRPEPAKKIITQGRWECGPASLAMLLDESLRDVKKAMVACGWNNDDRGCSDKQLIDSAKLLGHEIHRTLEPNNNPCLITVRSLNYKKSNHAVFWNGSEILDPNWGYNGRFWYGTEWGPKTIHRIPRVITYKKYGCPDLPFSKPTSVKKLKEQLVIQLNNKF